jgi:predicted lipoprotein
MDRARQATVALAGLRIAYGAALAAAPVRTARPWIGPAADLPATRVAVRRLGAREVLLHAGALAAALTGAPVRPWLLASIGGDCADIASTFAARDGVPDGAPRRTLSVAGASAALTVAAYAAVDG